MRNARSTGRSRVGRVVSALVTTLLVAGTLVGLIYLVPSLFGYERYAITGGSMSSSIEQGSIVLTKDVPVEDLAVGDVITYLPPADSGVTTLVTHRISEVDPSDVEPSDSGARVFRTRGDANPDPDPWTFSLVEDTQPVVTHTVPLLGHVMIALADREVRMLVIGVPAGLVALFSLVELVQGIGGTLARRRTAVNPVAAPTPAPADRADATHVIEPVAPGDDSADHHSDRTAPQREPAVVG